MKGFDPHIMKALINVHLDSTGSLAVYSGPYSEGVFSPLWQNLDYVFLIRMKNSYIKDIFNSTILWVSLKI